MPAAGPFSPFLSRQGVAVLDGGLATELERRGHDLSDELWSARLLSDRPQAIAEVHLDYLRAGADCIVTASYQATFEGFARRGLDAEAAREVLLLSVDLARRARRRFLEESPPGADRPRPLVAASIGPYGAFLADGSEYRGDYGLSEEELVAFHRRRWRVLAAAGADLLACESIPSRPEAHALARLAAAAPETPFWLAFTCRDGRSISDGTPLADIAGELAGTPGLVALGVNCTAPRHLPSLIDSLAAASDLPIVVYPNSGERWDAETRRWRPAEEEPDLVAAAPGWVERGARIVGGCCRTTPEQIRRLCRALTRAG